MGLQTSSTSVNLASPPAIGNVTPAPSVTTDYVQVGSLGVVFPSRGFFQAGASNGIFLVVNSVGATPDRLVLGQADNTTPALVPNGTELGFKLGDSSAYTKIIASKPRFTAIPTSSSGLSTGDVYSNLGVLTIVP